MLENPQGGLDLESNTQLIIGQSAGNFSKDMKGKKNKYNQYITALKELNTLKKQKKKPFSWYKEEIKTLFKISNPPKISVKYKTFLGGLIAGEGSINVSAKKSSNALFGVIIDPEFSITQHFDGFFFLFGALLLFETGSIHFKSGREGTFVYRIDNRRSLVEKVIPFWETYVFPYQEIKQKQKMKDFKEIITLLENKKHKNFFSFRDQILPLWDKLRKQKGHYFELFPDLESAQRFVVRKGSSETTRDLI